jgi:hypothetical protein
VNGLGRRTTRSRASSVTDRFSRIAEDEPFDTTMRPTISSRLPSGQNSPRRELPGFDLPSRPVVNRGNTGFEAPTSFGREASPGGMPRLSRVPTEPTQLLGARNNLRVTKRDYQGGDTFGDDQSDYSDLSLAPSRSTSWSVAGQEGSSIGKKAPPPPPSRAKKPPPPPPLKRSALSTSEIPQY